MYYRSWYTCVSTYIIRAKEKTGAVAGTRRGPRRRGALAGVSYSGGGGRLRGLISKVGVGKHSQPLLLAYRNFMANCPAGAGRAEELRE